MIGLVGGGIVVGVPALVNDISFDKYCIHLKTKPKIKP